MAMFKTIMHFHLRDSSVSQTERRVNAYIMSRLLPTHPRIGIRIAAEAQQNRRKRLESVAKLRKKSEILAYSEEKLYLCTRFLTLVTKNVQKQFKKEAWSDCVQEIWTQGLLAVCLSWT